MRSYFQNTKSRRMMPAKWQNKQKHRKLCRNGQNQVFQNSGKLSKIYIIQANSGQDNLENGKKVCGVFTCRYSIPCMAHQ